MAEENQNQEGEWVESTEYEYEYWDCRYCGQKAIRGDIKNCSACGHPRDADVTFYNKTEAEKITDETVIKTLGEGPDWGCSFCQTMNAHQVTTCKGCGNTRSASDKNYFEIQQKKAEKEAANLPVEEAAGGGGWKKILLYGGIAAVVVGGIIFWATRSHKVIYKVEKLHWKTMAPVERYSQGRFESWQNEVNGDQIQTLNSIQKIRRYEKRQIGTTVQSYTDYEQVQSGTKKECRTETKSSGSGMKKTEKICKNVPVYKSQAVQKTRTVPIYRDEPIYDNWVIYTAKKYTLFAYNEKEGVDNAPVWAEVTLGEGLDNKTDRALTKSGVYTVTIHKKNPDDKGPGNFQFTTTQEKFTKKYILQKDVEMIVGQMGGVKLEKDEKEVEAAKAP